MLLLVPARVAYPRPAPHACPVATACPPAAPRQLPAGSCPPGPQVDYLLLCIIVIDCFNLYPAPVACRSNKIEVIPSGDVQLLAHIGGGTFGEGGGRCRDCLAPSTCMGPCSRCNRLCPGSALPQSVPRFPKRCCWSGRRAKGHGRVEQSLLRASVQGQGAEHRPCQLLGSCHTLQSAHPPPRAFRRHVSRAVARRIAGT